MEERIETETEPERKRPSLRPRRQQAKNRQGRERKEEQNTIEKRDEGMGWDGIKRKATPKYMQTDLPSIQIQINKTNVDRYVE